MLELSWLFLLLVNVVPFGLYILYMMRIAKKRPWNIRIDRNYEPNISVVIPTYEEETTIVKKLDNLAQADYPKEKLDITIVDSASKDRTFALAQEWSARHPELRVQMVRQSERRGMVNALNEGLKHANGDIFLKTDADCMLLKDSLRNAVKYIADSNVGSVAGLHVIESRKETSSVKTERTYRDLYRLLRIGESKLHSTVLYEGELMLVRSDLIHRIEFDERIGGDDVATALRVAKEGYRAITAEDAFFVEQTPYTWKEKFHQKTRRGSHVFQALWKYRNLALSRNTVFHRLILPMEIFIYVFNPFVTLLLTIVSIPLVVRYPWLLLASTLLLIDRVRELFVTYYFSNWIMLLAIIREAISREKITWRKIDEIRE